LDQFRSIESFLTTVECGSIAAAARKMGVIAAAVSQSLRRLENELNVMLLTRTTRRISLTEAGATYYERIKPLVAGLAAAAEEISEREGEVTGRLRIAASVAYGRHRIAAIVGRFASMHPKLSVELILADRSVDHVSEDIDVSIRFSLMLEPGLIAQKVSTESMFLCAAPSYLERRGWPSIPDDLGHHDCLTFRFPVDGRLLRWSFNVDGVRVTPVLKTFVMANDIDALVEMAIAGVGITRLGRFIIGDHLDRGRLVPLFTGTHGPRIDPEPFDFYACYLDRRSKSPKVRLFIDYLKQSLRD
jgi:DNA-binding transcriptional LysR family regulator